MWAKHDHDAAGWLPLWRHMEDSAAVAGLLWDKWVPAALRTLVAEVLPGRELDGRALVVWLAGVHDIGKATPAFACQVDELANAMRDHGLEMRSQQAMGPDRRPAPHGLAGQLLLGEWLEESHGWAPGRTGQFTVAVGGHHGTPPEHGQIKAAFAHEELLRTPGPSASVWRSVQHELLDVAAGAIWSSGAFGSMGDGSAAAARTGAAHRVGHRLGLDCQQPWPLSVLPRCRRPERRGTSCLGLAGVGPARALAGRGTRLRIGGVVRLEV